MFVQGVDGQKGNQVLFVGVKDGVEVDVGIGGSEED